MGGGCDIIADPLGCTLGAITNAVLAELIQMMLDTLELVVQMAFGWWIEVDSILPSAANTPVRGQVAWLALALVTAGLIAAGIRISIARRGEPAIEAVKGLVTVAMVSATGLVVVRSLVQAGDQWAAQLMAAGVDGVGDEIAAALMMTSAQPGLVLLLGIIVFLLSLGQAALMLFREGAIIMLTGMLPLAAAGQMLGIGRQWLPKVTGWLLALVLYKPIAALAYFSVFQFVDSADGLRELLVAVVMLGMSVFALPAMMKFFSWTTGQVGAGGGGGGLATAAVGAGLMAAAGRSSSFGAAPVAATTSREDAINRSLGPAGGSGGGSGGGSSAAPTGAVVSVGRAGGAKFAGVAAGPAGVAVAAADVAKSAKGAAVNATSETGQA